MAAAPDEPAAGAAEAKAEEMNIAVLALSNEKYRRLSAKIRQVDPSRGGYHITYSGATAIGSRCDPCSESDEAPSEERSFDSELKRRHRYGNWVKISASTNFARFQQPKIGELK